MKGVPSMQIIEKCNNYIGPVEAQHLTVRILAVLPVSVGKEIVNELARRESGSLTAAERQLLRCISLSSELRTEPKRYDSLDALCMTILRRKLRRDSSKKEYGEALGVNKMQRGRLERGEAALSLEQVRSICSGFRDPAVGRFWENVLLSRYPGIADLGRGDGPEADSFRILYKRLDPNDYHLLAQKLEGREKQRLAEEFLLPVLRGSDIQKFGAEPDKLYSVLRVLASRSGMLIADIAVDELGISANTWYAWKKAWEKSENNGFRDGVPRGRLKRTHMILLAFLFRLDYLESVYFLALAGYRYIEGEPDDRVLQYFMPCNTVSYDEVLCYLKEGLNTGKW